MPEMKEGDSTVLEGWNTKKVAGNIWRLKKSITMTGSNVDTVIGLPAHRLVRLELYHTDSAHAASVDSLAARLFRNQGKILGSQYHLTDIYNKSGLTNSFIIKTFGEGYEYEESDWTLRLNSTSTDIIEVLLYVQVLS